MTPPLRTFLVAMVCALCVATSVRADELATIRQRISLRASLISVLKEQGLVREQVGATLATTGTVDDFQREQIAAENADRLRVFEIVAQRTKKSVEEVRQTFDRLAKAQPVVVTASTATTASAPPVREPAPVAATPTPARPTASKPPAAPAAPISGVSPKVITRPFAHGYEQADSNSRRVRANIPAFSIFYQLRRDASGWVEISESLGGNSAGWLKPEDFVEWKQNLVVEFSHPEGRKPVLMFDQLDPLQTLTRHAESERQREAAELYSAIDRGSIPADFPVRSMEPYRAVDSRDQFYLLPIVDYRESSFSGREGRLLQLAAATRKRGAIDIRKDDSRDDLTRRTRMRGDVNVDLVFVMDLTLSMDPFVERTLKMIQDSVARLGADRDIHESLRLGFWGYRDFPEVCRGIEFNTRNYTPELQTMSKFAETLRGVRETKIDSGDFAEDVFSGVAEAIQKTRWRPGAQRLIVVVGDAPGRAPGFTEPEDRKGLKLTGTKCGMNEHDVRALANSNDVYLTALFLKGPPRYDVFSARGIEQFRVLGKNKNTEAGQENFSVLRASEPALYGKTARALADGIAQNILALRGRAPLPADSATVSAPGGDTEITTEDAAEEAGARLARNMFRGAVVEWLGKEDAATVPRDITAWVSDKDLLDPAIQSLQVKLFLTKNQLNTLKQVLDDVLNAGLHGKLSGKKFFDALRSVVTVAGRDASQIHRATTVGDSGLMPDFLKNLPYQSTLMGMSNESWAQLSPDEQDQQLRSIESNLRFYQAISENADNWQALNDGDDPDNWVAAVPLDRLP